MHFDLIQIHTWLLIALKVNIPGYNMQEEHSRKIVLTPFTILKGSQSGLQLMEYFWTGITIVMQETSVCLHAGIPHK